jgi:hypothetical protein
MPEHAREGMVESAETTKDASFCRSLFDMLS